MQVCSKHTAERQLLPSLPFVKPCFPYPQTQKILDLLLTLEKSPTAIIALQKKVQKWSVFCYLLFFDSFSSVNQILYIQAFIWSINHTSQISNCWVWRFQTITLVFSRIIPRFFFLVWDDTVIRLCCQFLWSSLVGLNSSALNLCIISLFQTRYTYLSAFPFIHLRRDLIKQTSKWWKLEELYYLQHETPEIDSRDSTMYLVSSSLLVVHSIHASMSKDLCTKWTQMLLFSL